MLETEYDHRNIDLESVRERETWRCSNGGAARSTLDESTNKSISSFQLLDAKSLKSNLKLQEVKKLTKSSPIGKT